MRTAERGVALVVALLAMALMSALGAALVLTTSSESLVASRFRDGSLALDAADAALERALGDLTTAADWNPVLDGSARSTFFDGPPSGARTTPAGVTVDLTAVVNLANCGRRTACTPADMDAATADRPWGVNNPRWQVYACGSLDRLLPAGTVKSPFYVVVLVGDDPSEDDGDPLRDGIGPANPGRGAIALQGEAFGARGLHAVIRMVVSRAGPVLAHAGIRVLLWREVR